jgi:non-ribosomal peptide synthetase component F
MQTALQSLVAALENAPDTPLQGLEVMPAEEREQVLYGWNDTAADYPSDQCVHQLFEQQVARTPDAVALVFEDNELSYAELNRRANQLAHHLRELGVRPDDRVALCVERGFEMIVAILAVLKAGGAYVPLDPAYPADRLRFMLDDSQPVALLTQTHLAERFADNNTAPPCSCSMPPLSPGRISPTPTRNSVQVSPPATSPTSSTPQVPPEPPRASWWNIEASSTGSH